MKADSPLSVRSQLNQAGFGAMALLLGSGILGSGLLLSGCVAVPDTGPRPIALTASGIAANVSLAAGDHGQWPADNWWTAYGDPQLDSLMAEGLANSPDVAAATARLKKAGALAQQAGAALLPSLDAGGTVGYSKQSLNEGYPQQFVALLPQGWDAEGALNTNFNWDIDLWGRNRAALRAATSERRAAAVDAQQAALMLTTGIAQAYADLGAALALRDNRAAALDSRTASQALTDQRMREGLDNRGSLRTAQAQADSARSDLISADQAVLLRRHQLAALLGAGPDRGLAIAPPRLAPLGLHELPVGVTTALMARRPDIVAARVRVEAAASRIKVARADFYPSLKLQALVGVQSLGLSQLFTGNSTYGSAGPAVDLPLFHGGALRGAYRGARADYDLAVADYDRTVLTAYQQVADAVTDRGLLARQLAQTRAAVTASEEANAIASARYRGGLSNYLDALIVQDRLVETREAAVMIDAAYRSADIALIRALGGGFAETAPATALSTATAALPTPKDYSHE